ncbi:hypothetical protein ACIO6T_41315 [Streptomyces sp. NPDC087532]|uniref:hypothetical protein n=1 Tax=unclassified Streptomyces TaxID=2593676 RepID=UPI0034329920
MSIGIVVHCDRSGQYGTCAAQLHTGASTEADAYAAAERAGWDVNGTPDLCPVHAPRTQPPAPPTRLRPTRST